MIDARHYAAQLQHALKDVQSGSQEEFDIILDTLTVIAQAACAECSNIQRNYSDKAQHEMVTLYGPGR